MTFKSYREESRTNWGTSQDAALTQEQIRTGCFLRIADATEKMAQRHTDLIDERDRLQRQVKRLQERVDFLERSRASLKGKLRSARARAFVPVRIVSPDEI